MQALTADALTQQELISLFLVVGAGFMWFVRIARRRSITAWRLKSFFLGGARIGPELTEHNTLGITFAWSGGTWFFVTVAYHSGPWVVLLQIPWVFSILLLAALFRRILPVTRDRTIHGFLANLYGGKVQRVGALATTAGYIVNTGFELFWASLMFAAIVGRPDLSLIIALLMAIVTGLYCSIGGYISNAETDKPQNILGVVSLAVLVLCVASQLEHGIALGAAVTVFTTGSALYVLVALLLPHTRTLRQERFQNWLAVAFAVTACLVTMAVAAVGGSGEFIGVQRNPLQNLPLLAPLFVGLLTFQTFFNAIDMANWQQIAANGDEPVETQGLIQWSIVRGSLYLFWFPALGGMLLGCLLRILSTDIADPEIFTPAFGLVLPGDHSILRGLILGFLALGFLATSLSTVDTMLMSAVQTITYDLVWVRRLQETLKSGNADRERHFVLKARALLIPVAALMVLVFWGLFRAYPGDALNFQPMMYAWALALFAPVMFGLFQARATSVRSANWVFGGMCLAIAAVCGLFAVAVTPRFAVWKDWALNVMPVASNGIMLIACLVGRYFGRAVLSADEAVNVR